MRDRTITAHGLTFVVRSEDTDLAEDGFKLFCGGLQQRLERNDFEEARELHRGWDGAMGVDFHDGSSFLTDLKFSRGGVITVRSAIWCKPDAERAALIGKYL
jgi:hypothetical protein